MTFVIGDVHGCFHTLMSLIEKLPDNAKLIFVGDLCDKGNFTYEVIQYIIDNNHTSVKGNHDYIMAKSLNDAIFNRKRTLWTSQLWGGDRTVKSYVRRQHKVQEHIDFINSLPFYIELENVFITHGFGAPYYYTKDQNHRALLSNRIDRIYTDWGKIEENPKINIFGHCDFHEVQFENKYIGIDTGAVYGRKLTAINIETFEIFQEETNILDIM